MGRYFKIIIFISYYKKKNLYISVHNLALITWHLKTHSQKMFSTIVLQEGKKELLLRRKLS